MRITGFNVVIISQWTDPRENDRHIAWCRDTYYGAHSRIPRPIRYVNYLGSDEAGDPAAVAYGTELSAGCASSRRSTIPRTSSTRT